MDILPGRLLTTGKRAGSLSGSTGGGGGSGTGPMQQAWREGIAKACERINALKDIVGSLENLEILQESERPARGLLEDEQVADAILSHLAEPSSGHGHDALCQWLYDTFQTGDLDLQAVVLRYMPALCGLYLPRALSCNDESLAGFEAVLLALYASEAKARQGSPVVINIPDLSQESLYHAPQISSTSPPDLHVGHLSCALEPQDTIKSTKRACIVGVVLDLFCRRIAVMPGRAKVEACQCALRVARFSCLHEDAVFDPPDDEGMLMERIDGENHLAADHTPGPASPKHIPEVEIVGPCKLGYESPSYRNANVTAPNCLESMKQLSSDLGLPSANAVDLASSFLQAGNGARIPLPLELSQPLIRILGHCLFAPSKNSEEVKEAASIAVKALYWRAFHDLMPEAMLAARSLVRLERASKQLTKSNFVSGTSTAGSSKQRKPEILLTSK